jgi:nucleotide-binding universal stress UspA family protein
MKIMATFDGSEFAESILPQLAWMAVLPEAQFLLFSVAAEPSGQPRHPAMPAPHVVSAMQGAQPVAVEPAEPAYAETKDQAMARRQAELEQYLRGVARRLPVGPRYTVDACISDDPVAVIIARAVKERPDVIVMATHGRSGLTHMVFGGVAEEVVRSGVAPVLLVHPNEVRRARGTARSAG